MKERLRKTDWLIDRIDTTLARRYGFTHEKLDFIINYHINTAWGRRWMVEWMSKGNRPIFLIAKEKCNVC